MRKVLYIFGLLSDTDVEWIAQTGERRRVKDKEILIREGTPSAHVIFLLRGEFVVTTKATEVARLGVGEVVGEMSFVDSAPPSATVSAAGDCIALFLDKAALTRKVETDVAFGFRFYRALAVFLADRLRGTVHRLTDDGHLLDSNVIAKDELDIGVLDNVSIAGERFHRMLRTLSGEQ